MVLAKGKAQADLDGDRLLQLALVRPLEIVGEAANRVPQRVREQHPDIPCHQIVALRNRLIHGYDAVDLNILWQIIVHDLPPLAAALERILAGYDVQQEG